MNTSFAAARAIIFSAFICVASTGSQAGAISGGAWSPVSCGTKPIPPVLDLSSADAYNKSVDSVNAYRQAIRPYIDCLVKEANADIQAVTKSATVEQQAAKAANDKIQADVKAAEEKFK